MGAGKRPETLRKAPGSVASTLKHSYEGPLYRFGPAVGGLVGPWRTRACRPSSGTGRLSLPAKPGTLPTS